MMKNLLKHGLLVAGLAVAFTACQQEDDLAVSTTPSAPSIDNLVKYENGQVIPGEYIVVFKGEIADKSLRGVRDYATRQNVVRKQVATVLADHGVDMSATKHVYSGGLQGFAVTASEDRIIELEGDPRVDYIEPNRMVVLAPWYCIFFPSHPNCAPPPPPAGEQTPCGITAVNGGANYTGNKRAWVLDTGIDGDHDDLNVNAGLSANFSSNSNWDDGHGHGSHVAGTIAAIGGNNLGVVGVAAGAEVVAVKVLSNSGSGSNAGVIAGVDYVGQNASAGDVANMSLGGGVSQAVDDAVLAAANNNGILFFVAAGNDSHNAANNSPARAGGVSSNDNVFTISAVNCSKSFASFSNYGADVEYCAPGVSTYSTYRNNGYATLSGTSMATPHAAGVALAGNGSWTTNGTASGDPHSPADPFISL